MNHSEFCWWAWGFFEIQNPKEVTAQQVTEIKNHLDLVFNNARLKEEMKKIEAAIPGAYQPKVKDLPVQTKPDCSSHTSRKSETRYC